MNELILAIEHEIELEKELFKKYVELKDWSSAGRQQEFITGMSWILTLVQARCAEQEDKSNRANDEKAWPGLDEAIAFDEANDE